MLFNVHIKIFLLFLLLFSMLNAGSVCRPIKSSKEAVGEHAWHLILAHTKEMPMLSALKLGTLSFSKSQVRIKRTVRLLGQELVLSGLLRVNAKAHIGETLASFELKSLHTPKVSDWFTLNRLELSGCIIKGRQEHLASIKIMPTLSFGKKRLTAYALLDSNAKQGMALTFKPFKLKELSPKLPPVSFLQNALAYRLDVSGERYVLRAKIAQEDILISYDKKKKSLDFSFKNMALLKFMPQLKAMTVLKKAQVEHVTLSASGAKLKARIDDKPLFISWHKDKSMTLSSKAFLIKQLLPLLKPFDVAQKITIDTLTVSKEGLKINAMIQGQKILFFTSKKSAQQSRVSAKAKGLTLGQLIPRLQSIEGLSGLKAEALTFGKQSLNIKTTLYHTPLEVAVGRNKEHPVVIYLSELKLSDMVVGFKSLKLPDLRLKNVRLILSFKNMKNFNTSHIAQARSHKKSYSYRRKALQAGFNIDARLDLKESKRVVKLLKKLHIKANTLTLQGVTDVTLFKSIAHNQAASSKVRMNLRDKKRFLDALDMKIELPKFYIAQWIKSLQKPILRIKGDADKGLDISVDFDAKFKGIEGVFKSAIYVNEKSLKLRAHLQKSFLNLFDLDFLSFKELQAELDLEQKKVLKLFAKVRFFNRIEEHARIILEARSKGLAFKRLKLDRPIRANRLFPALHNSAFLKDFEISVLSREKGSLYFQGTIDKKRVAIKEERKRHSFTLKGKNLKLTDFISSLKGVPLIEDLAFDTLFISKKGLLFDAKLGGMRFSIGHARDKNSAHISALYLPKLSLSDFIPQLKGTFFDDMHLKNIRLLYLDGDKKRQNINTAILPAPQNQSFKKEQKRVFSGFTIDASIDLKGSKKFVRLLKSLHMNPNRLKLTGRLPANIFAQYPGKKGLKKIKISEDERLKLLALVDLKIDLPKPKWASFLTLNSKPKLHIKGGSFKASHFYTLLPKSLQKSSHDTGLSLYLSMHTTMASLKNEPLRSVVRLDHGVKQNRLTLLCAIEKAWKNPFGLPQTVLEKGAFVIDISKKSKHLKLFAEASLLNKGPYTIGTDFTLHGNQVAFDFFELDGSVKLSALPFGSKIPHAQSFLLHDIKLFKEGLEAQVSMWGDTFDLLAFNEGGAVLALKTPLLDLLALAPALSKFKALKGFKLPKSTLILSQKGLTLSKQSLLVKRAFIPALKEPLHVKSGLAILSRFEPKAMGIIGEGLVKIGLPKGSILYGAIQGLFGQGSFGFSLDAQPKKSAKAKGLPTKILGFKKAPAYHLGITGDTLQLGASFDALVKAAKETLDFKSSIDLEFNEKGIALKLLGAMQGSWKKPFGIKGIELKDPKLDISVDEAGEVRVGFSGSEMFGLCNAQGKGKACLNVHLAAEASLLLEDALPDGLAFKARVNRFGIEALLDIASGVTGKKLSLSRGDIPYFELKNALLAFATPGVSDPDLGLDGNGFAVGGELNFMSRDLGKIYGVADGTGIRFKGSIDDIKLDDILYFKNNQIDMYLSKTPSFKMHSSMDIFGANQNVTVDIAPPQLSFELKEQLGSFGDARLKVTAKGVDVTRGSFEPNSDIEFIGAFDANIESFIKANVIKGVNIIKTSADTKLKADKAALKKAQEKVAHINAKIKKIREQDDRVKKRAELKIAHAQKRVDHLWSRYNHYNHQAHHCGNRWTHWACKGYWYALRDGTRGAISIAEGVLEAVKKAVASAFDLDPRIVALQGSRDLALDALALAKAVVEAAMDAEDYVLNRLDKDLNNVLDHFPFEMKKAFLTGELRGMITKAEPMVLDMDYLLFNHKEHDYFALKIPENKNSLTFDLVSFALLPAKALDDVVQKSLDEIKDKQVKRWIEAHIATKLAQAEAKVHKMVSGVEKKFAKVLQSFEKGNAQFKKAFKELSDRHQQSILSYGMSDLLGPSKLYKSTYLAIGHSDLCLGVAPNGHDVYGENCKDQAQELWHTKSLADGYVELKSQGLCLKAKSRDNKNGQVLVLSTCDPKDMHEQWKIFSNDGFYDKIINRYAQRCLHFENENSNPKAAKTVWTSCSGFDSQTFRAISDAQKPSFYKLEQALSTAEGNCLYRGEGLEWIKSSTFTFTRVYDIFSAPCNKKSLADKKLRFNYVERPNGDIKIIDSKLGYCMMPYDSEGNLGVVLHSCDRGKDMFWEPIDRGEGSLEFKNRYYNRCLQAPLQRNESLGSCRDTKANQFKFIP